MLGKGSYYEFIRSFPAYCRSRVDGMVDVAEEPAKVYKHGYTEEAVARITAAKKAIDVRDLSEEPVSIDEVREVIVPWNRIHRVKEFNLHPVKVTGKKKVVAKSPLTAGRKRVATKPKVKKLTKKFIADEIGRIVFKIALQESLTEEEQAFYDEHTSKEELI